MEEKSIKEDRRTDQGAQSLIAGDDATQLKEELLQREMR